MAFDKSDFKSDNKMWIRHNNNHKLDRAKLSELFD